LVDPGTLSDDDRKAAGTVALSSDQAEEIAALDGSERLRTILGDPAVDVIVAVRRYEHETYSHLDADALTDKFRMAWSL
jgi:glutamine synthetase